jgi:hypothetical protein
MPHRPPKKEYKFIRRLHSGGNRLLLREPTPNKPPYAWLRKNQVFTGNAYTKQAFVACIDEDCGFGVTRGGVTTTSNSDLVYCSECGRYYNDPPGCPKHGGFR